MNRHKVTCLHHFVQTDQAYSELRCHRRIEMFLELLQRAVRELSLIHI